MKRILLCLAVLLFSCGAARADWIEGPRFTGGGTLPAAASGGACGFGTNSLGKYVPSCAPEEAACFETFHFANNTESWKVSAIEWESSATDTDAFCYQGEFSCYKDGADLTSLGSPTAFSLVTDNQASTANQARISGASGAVAPYDVGGSADCASDACDNVTCRVCIWRESTGCTSEITEDVLLNAVQVDKNQ